MYKLKKKSYSESDMCHRELTNNASETLIIHPSVHPPIIHPSAVTLTFYQISFKLHELIDFSQ